MKFTLLAVSVKPEQVYNQQEVETRPEGSLAVSLLHITCCRLLTPHAICAWSCRSMTTLFTWQSMLSQSSYERNYVEDVFSSLPMSFSSTEDVNFWRGRNEAMKDRIRRDVYNVFKVFT